MFLRSRLRGRRPPGLGLAMLLLGERIGPPGDGLLLLPAHADGLLGSLPGAGVGVGPLAVDGQAAPVPEPLVTADLHLPLDVLRDLAAQVALDLVVGLDELAQADDLVVGEVADAGVGVHAGADGGFPCTGAADAEDVGEADLEALLAGEVDAGDAGHAVSPAAACDGGCSSR